VSVRILIGDCRASLAALPERSVQTCVTSPPYFGLRDYGHAGQLGLEPTPDEYVAAMVDVFRAVRRVLRDDGTVFLNLGDSYANTGASTGAGTRGGLAAAAAKADGRPRKQENRADGALFTAAIKRGMPPGLKPKDLIGIPWMVAFALRADGWYLRSDIVWAKPNPMPESVTDRPTKAHEYVFLLSKAERYVYDADAIAEEAVTDPERESVPRGGFAGKTEAMPGRNAFRAVTPTRNARSVWTIATQPYSGAHFATMPPVLAERCVLAGSQKGDTVLDPFGGAGTTALVADRLGRDAVICELNPEYARLAEARIRADAPMFADVTREDAA
jgi:DNA modification methylase